MRTCLLFFFILLVSFASAKEFPPVPKTFIQDNTGTVEKPYWDSINNLLADLEEQTGTQFLVYVADSLNGEVLETYVNSLYNFWELGKKGKDNGILLAVFVKDKSFRIEIGYGLEGRIPDLLSYKYQEKYLIPEFKNGNYGKGILDCSKALADAASGFLYDFFGEKKQREIDSLIIKDEANVFSQEQRGKFLYDLHKTYEYENYSEFHTYYFITSSYDVGYMKTRLASIWNELQKKQGFVENKILIGISTTQPFFGCMMDDELKPSLTIKDITYISEIRHADFILGQWNSKDFFYVSRNVNDYIVTSIRFSVFKKKYPIYTKVFSVFYDSPSELMWNHSSAIIYSLILLGLLIPVLLIIFLVLINKKLEAKTKKILITWSFLNYFIPFLGYIVQLFLVAKAIKLLFKMGNYEEKIKIINEKSYFGYLKDFFSGRGGSGGSYTYSSSGSSYSSRSSSGSSSYSSSSSSSRSFGGGGGGRSGGGGSSGKW